MMQQRQTRLLAQWPPTPLSTIQRQRPNANPFPPVHNTVPRPWNYVRLPSKWCYSFVLHIFFFLFFFTFFFCTFLVKQNYSICSAKSEQATRQLQVINKSRFSHTRFALVLQDLYSNCDMNSNPKKQSNRFLPLQTVHSTLCRPPDCSLVLSEAYAHVQTRTHSSGTTLVNAQHIAAGTSMGIWLAPMKIHPGLVTKPLYQNWSHSVLNKSTNTDVLFVNLNGLRCSYTINKITYICWWFKTIIII